MVCSHRRAEGMIFALSGTLTRRVFFLVGPCRLIYPVGHHRCDGVRGSRHIGFELRCTIWNDEEKINNCTAIAPHWNSYMMIGGTGKAGSHEEHLGRGHANANQSAWRGLI